MDDKLPSCPFELLPDGDLLFLIHRMLRIRGLGSLRISKVKGHADEAMVRAGTVRGVWISWVMMGADEVADFGRRRVPWTVSDARRNLSGVCSRWRPLVLVLHRFFIAISRAVVNHGDGAASVLDPLVWSAGSAPKRRRVAVRNRAFFTWTTGSLGWCLDLCCCHPPFPAGILRFGLSLLVCLFCGFLLFPLYIGLLVGVTLV